MAHKSNNFYTATQPLTVEAVQAMTDDQLRQHPVLGSMFRRGWEAQMEANNHIERNHIINQLQQQKEKIQSLTKSKLEASLVQLATAATMMAVYNSTTEERVPPILSDWSVAERALREKPVQEKRKRQRRNKIENSYSRYLSGKTARNLQSDETK